MWAERNRVRPRRDEEPKPSRWWRSRWNVALPARKARNRFLGLRLWRSSPTRRPAACTDFSKPKSSPARQSGNQRWLARVPGAGTARLSAYRHALARRSGGRSSTLSLGAHYPVQPEALSAGHAPQSRTSTPPTLRGRIQLPAQPPHYGGQSVSAPGAGLSHNQHCHLQGFNRRAGSSLIFIKINFQHLLPDLALQLCHPIRLRPLVSRAHKGACPQLLLFVIPAVHLARTSSNSRASRATGSPACMRRTAVNLNSRVNLRFDIPIPLRCILWVFWVSQNWGPLHFMATVRSSSRSGLRVELPTRGLLGLCGRGQRGMAED